MITPSWFSEDSGTIKVQLHSWTVYTESRNLIILLNLHHSLSISHNLWREKCVFTLHYSMPCPPSTGLLAYIYFLHFWLQVAFSSQQCYQWDCARFLCSAEVLFCVFSCVFSKVLYIYIYFFLLQKFNFVSFFFFF